MWQYQYTDELYHHGVKGQRWGFRRYQNPDGSLTPAGRRRAEKLAKQYSKVTGKKLIVKKKSVKVNDKQKQKPKTISEMSDAELQAKINRINLEQNYVRLLASQAPKQKTSKGKKFIDTVKNQVIIPSAINAGKTVVTGMFTNAIYKVINNKDKKATKKATKQLKEQLTKGNKDIQKGEQAINKVYKQTVKQNNLGKITVDAKVYKQLDELSKKYK